MKSSITTGTFTREAGHSYRHPPKLTQDDVPDRTTENQTVLSGLERFCRKYGPRYCPTCLVEDCARRDL